MEDPACLPCEIAAGRVTVPGGTIHRTRHWSVDHCIGPLGLGTLVVKPERHVLHVADLADDEAAELGPLLRDTASVITRLTRPEQVYVALWSHAGGVPSHIHSVVQPVTRAVMDEYGHGPNVQARMFAGHKTPYPAEVETLAAAARRLFRSG